MARSVLVPMHLEARLVRGPSVSVPRWTDPPFTSTGTLEPGVHLHWALPDALCRGVPTRDQGASGGVLFPGIPDLWLIVRFNPATTILGGHKTRSYRSWMLDARATDPRPRETSTWTGAGTENRDRVPTVLGLLKPCGSAEHRGWGLRAEDATTAFATPPDALHLPLGAHAYYPESRKRFGFYDDLSDLAGRTGEISYVVIGWYSRLDQDPWHMATDRAALQRDWRWQIAEGASGRSALASVLATDSSGAGTWVPRAVTEGVAPGTRTAARTSGRAERTRTQLARSGLGGSNARPSVDTGPDHLVLHGSALTLSIGVDGVAPATSYSLVVGPTVSRVTAMALAADGAADRTVDYIEALLLGLDQGTGNLAAEMDVPASLHARSFESVPGEVVRRIGVLHVQSERDAGRPQHYEEWVAEVRATHGALKASDPLVHGRLLKVEQVDEGVRGRVARPLPLPRHVHVDDDAAMRALFTALDGRATAGPAKDSLIEERAAPWSRPRAPAVMLRGAGRSYRYGADGRFEADGTLRCRPAGETVLGLVPAHPSSALDVEVPAAQALAGRAALAAVKGLPSAALALLGEIALLDPANAGQIASAWIRISRADKPAVGDLESWLRKALLSRLALASDALSDADRALISGLVTLRGAEPSPIALTRSAAIPWAPVFCDLSAAFQTSTPTILGGLSKGSVATDLEVTTRTGPRYTFQERALLTATVPKLLESALFTANVRAEDGGRRPARAAPSGVARRDVSCADLLLCTLSGMDATLASKGLQVRLGSLGILRASVVDTFGTRLSKQGPTGTELVGGATLPPRFTTWSRVGLDLVRGDTAYAQVSTNEHLADALDPCVCGFLVPDRVEHALELFDAEGNPLGQLRSDRPVLRFKDSQGNISGTMLEAQDLECCFEPAYGVTDAQIPPSLLALRDAVVSRVTAVPASVNQDEGTWIKLPEAEGTFANLSVAWFESSLSGLLRMIDTVRATVAGGQPPGGATAQIAQPLALIRARVRLQVAAAGASPGPSGAALWPGGSATPLPLRVGNALQPDDGVLGRFDPTARVVYPVDGDAADRALLDGLREARELYQRAAGQGGTTTLSGNWLTSMPVRTPLVQRQDHLPIPPQAQRELLLLVDLRGSVRLAMGLLPRRVHPIPAEQVKPGLARLRPSFAVGPLLAWPGKDGLHTPFLPRPRIAGRSLDWGHEDAQGIWREQEIPPVPTGATPPLERVMLVRGLLRSRGVC